MEPCDIAIEIKIDVKKPIEVEDFVRSFSGIASQYHQFSKNSHGIPIDDSKIYIKEFRKGSILATLIPAAAPVLANIDQILICKDFVQAMGGTINALRTGASKGMMKSDLKDFHNTVAMIANDPEGSVKMEAATFTQTEKRTYSSFTFKTADARKVQETIDVAFREIQAIEIDVKPRVLMVFTRSDRNHAKLNTSSGEKVLIEELNTKALALMYASEIAESRIKHEIREAPENVYKKGFVVDVMVKTRSGKPIAYAVTDCYDVIDIEDEE